MTDTREQFNADERELSARLDALPVASGRSDAMTATIRMARTTEVATVGRSIALPSLRKALACLALFVALALTPPVQAIAGRVADAIGIGGSGSVDHSTDSFVPATSQSVVIGQGALADDQPFEIVAYTSSASAGDRDASGGAGASVTCLALDWPGSTVPRGSGGCIDGPQTEVATPVVSASAESLGPDAGLTLAGLAPPDVRRVVFTYETPSGSARVDATVGTLDGPLLEQVAGQWPASFYAAFLPASGSADGIRGVVDSETARTLTMRAFADDGKVVADRDLGALFGATSRN